MEFPRGDGPTHTFSIPASSWVPGGKLRFAAKPAIDDDVTDAAAVINHEWDDSAVSNVTINGVAYKQYACKFDPADTNSILSNGQDSADYLGEFQFVPPSGVPMTFPPKPPKIAATVYFDVIRETT